MVIGAALAVVCLGEAMAQTWSQLTPEQQRILAPLKEDWPNIEPPRRKKWVQAFVEFVFFCV